MLEDEEWSKWSVSKIARQGKVSRPFVYKIMEENSHLLTFTSERTYTTKHGTTTTMNTTNIGKGKQTESPPADEVIPDSEQLNDDIEVTNLEENISTNEVVDTSKTDEVNNYDDSAVDNEETEVKTDSKPKQSQRQRKGKQRLVNPLSIGDKVRVKENHYFGGQEGIVTQLATPSTVIVAFDNDEIEEKKPESTSFINKSSQRGFLPPDVEIKDSHKKTYCINIGRDTLMKIKKYIEGKPIYTAENAINLLLPD